MKQAIPLPDIEFDALSLAELALMKQGAEQVNEAHRTLKKGGLNVVGESVLLSCSSGRQR